MMFSVTFKSFTKYRCVGMRLSWMTMPGFAEDAARTFKAHWGGSNTYQSVFSPENICCQKKRSAGTSEVASRSRDCQQNKLN